jgi:hypothetical protein
MREAVVLSEQEGVEEATTSAVARPLEGHPEMPKEATPVKHIAKELFPAGEHCLSEKSRASQLAAWASAAPATMMRSCFTDRWQQC